MPTLHPPFAASLGEFNSTAAAVPFDAPQAAAPATRKCEQADHRYLAGPYGVCRHCGGEFPGKLGRREDK